MANGQATSRLPLVRLRAQGLRSECESTIVTLRIVARDIRIAPRVAGTSKSPVAWRFADRGFPGRSCGFQERPSLGASQILFSPPGGRFLALFRPKRSIQHDPNGSGWCARCA